MVFFSLDMIVYFDTIPLFFQGDLNGPDSELIGNWTQADGYSLGLAPL